MDERSTLANRRSLSSPRSIPVLLAFAAVAVLTGMDALIKAVSPRYPTAEIAFLRFACGTLFSALAFAVVRPGWPSRDTVVANANRGVLVVITAVTFFYALGQLPLAETISLSFLAPVFVALFSALFLKEPVTARIVIALVAGFVGMLVIVSGQVDDGLSFRGPILGIAAALISAVTYALALTLLRARAQRDPAVTIVLFQNLAPALFVAPFALWVWVTPSLSDLGIMMLIGALGTTGHLLYAHAFKRAPAAGLAVLEYTALIWASGLGYLVFGEIPTWATFIGAGLIVAGAAVASRR